MAGKVSFMKFYSHMMLTSVDSQLIIYHNNLGLRN